MVNDYTGRSRLAKCPEEARIEALDAEVKFLRSEVRFMVRIVWAALILIVAVAIWQIMYYGWEVTWVS